MQTNKEKLKKTKFLSQLFVEFPIVDEITWAAFHFSKQFRNDFRFRSANACENDDEITVKFVKLLKLSDTMPARDDESNYFVFEPRHLFPTFAIQDVVMVMI